MGGHSLLAFVSFLSWIWFTGTICCLYLERVNLHFKASDSDFGTKVWKRWKWKSVSSGQAFNCWQVNACWQASDSLSFSSGKIQNPCLLPVIIPISCISWPSWVRSPYCPWNTMLQLLLIFVSIKKINILLASTAGNKEGSHVHEVNSKISDIAHPYLILQSVYALETKGPGPDDYSKGWEVSEVRESVSESNRGGLVTILFVLRAWDWSLVFDAMRASMGPQYSISHRLSAFLVSMR